MAPGALTIFTGAKGIGQTVMLGAAHDVAREHGLAAPPTSTRATTSRPRARTRRSPTSSTSSTMSSPPSRWAGAASSTRSPASGRSRGTTTPPPGFVSRDYRIERAALAGGAGQPVLSLVGGKWTTFRALSEHLADEVLGLLGRTRKVSTGELPIGGGREFPATPEAVERWLKAHTGGGIDAARAEVLLSRYGTRASHVIEFLRAGEDSLLQSTKELSVRELEWMALHEQVGHAIDILIRRTSLAFRGLVTAELVDEVAGHCARFLGWDAQHTRQEVERAVATLADRHRVDVSRSGALA